MAPPPLGGPERLVSAPVLLSPILHPDQELREKTGFPEASAAAGWRPGKDLFLEGPPPAVNNPRLCRFFSHLQKLPLSSGKQSALLSALLLFKSLLFDYLCLSEEEELKAFLLRRCD